MAAFPLFPLSSPPVFPSSLLSFSLNLQTLQLTDRRKGFHFLFFFQFSSVTMATSTPTPPHYLPGWLKYRVFTSAQLSFKDLARCESVCRDWRDFLSRSDCWFWREMTCRELTGAGIEDLREQKVALQEVVNALRDVKLDGEDLLVDFVTPLLHAVQGAGNRDPEFWRKCLKRFYRNQSSLVWPYVIRFALFKLSLRLGELVKFRFSISGSADPLDPESKIVKEYEFGCDEIYSVEDENVISSGLRIQSHCDDTRLDAPSPLHNPPNTTSDVSVSLWRGEGSSRWSDIMTSEGHPFLSWMNAGAVQYGVHLNDEAGISCQEWDEFSWDCECSGFVIMRTTFIAYVHFMEICPTVLSPFRVMHTRVDRTSTLDLEDYEELKVIFGFGKRNYAANVVRVGKDVFCSDILRRWDVNDEREKWNLLHDENSEGMHMCVLTRENHLIVGRTGMDTTSFRSVGQGNGVSYCERDLFFWRRRRSRGGGNVNPSWRGSTDAYPTPQSALALYHLYKLTHKYKYDKTNGVVFNYQLVVERCRNVCLIEDLW